MNILFCLLDDEKIIINEQYDEMIHNHREWLITHTIGTHKLAKDRAAVFTDTPPCFPSQY